MTTVLVAANGHLDQPSIQKRLDGLTLDVIIAADGGFHHLQGLGLTADKVVGDLDSVDEGRLPEGIQPERHPAEKDETDLELALHAALEHDPDRVIVIGAGGGRLDMTLGNLILLTAFAVHPIEVWHEQQTLQVIVPPGMQIEAASGDTLSLIPLKGDVNHITTRGLAYPLNNETLVFGPSRGLSNVFESSTASIMFEQGLLLAIHTPGKA